MSRDRTPRSLADRRLHPADWQFRSLGEWQGIRPSGLADARKFFHRRGHRVKRKQGTLAGVAACDSCAARFYTLAVPGWHLFWCALTEWEAHEIERCAMSSVEVVRFCRLDSHDYATAAT